MQTETVDLTQSAAPGDRVHTTRGAFKVSRTVWPDNWPQPVTVEPLDDFLIDTFAPAEYLLPSNLRGPESVFLGGRVYHGPCVVRTTGRAPVRRNAGDWLRAEIEYHDEERSEWRTLRGLVRIDR